MFCLKQPTMCTCWLHCPVYRCSSPGRHRKGEIYVLCHALEYFTYNNIVASIVPRGNCAAPAPSRRPHAVSCLCTVFSFHYWRRLLGLCCACALNTSATVGHLRLECLHPSLQSKTDRQPPCTFQVEFQRHSNEE